MRGRKGLGEREREEGGERREREEDEDCEGYIIVIMEQCHYISRGTKRRYARGDIILH